VSGAVLVGAWVVGLVAVVTVALAGADSVGLDEPSGPRPAIASARPDADRAVLEPATSAAPARSANPPIVLEDPAVRSRAGRPDRTRRLGDDGLVGAIHLSPGTDRMLGQ
jgi:hypothetical protein